MMRRYSRPRHLTAGWTSPRWPLAMKSSGFTTMPSPPRPVSSSHQCVAAGLARRVGEVDDDVRRRVQQRCVLAADASEGLHVPGVVAVGVDAALAREQVERREAQVVEPLTGQQ